MKKSFGVVLFAMTALGASYSAPAFANADDTKWINQCVVDNKDQGQTTAVTTAYCTCMDNKMSSNETQSITVWEKSHKTEADACSKQAGWN
jgi:hypothetical protein